MKKDDEDKVENVSPELLVNGQSPAEIDRTEIKQAVQKMIPGITDSVLNEIEKIEASGRNISLRDVPSIFNAVFRKHSKEVDLIKPNELSDGNSTRNDK